MKDIIEHLASKGKEVTIEFMGVGSAFSKKFGNNSALITVNNDGEIKRLLIDCGRTTPDDLNHAGYTWDKIDAIFITHLHGDHVYGLEEAGFMGRYVFQKKPHIIFPHQKLRNDLWDKVLRGTMTQGDLDRQMNFNDYFTCEVVSSDEQFFDFNGVMFSVYPTIHVQNKKSYGLFIGERNFILYTSDSLMNRDLIEIAVEDGCQAIFHDCQFMDYQGQVHASLNQIKELDDKCKSLIYLMHYGDNLADFYMEIKDAGLNIATKNKQYTFIL